MKNVLHANPLHHNHRRTPLWWRKHALAIRLAFCFLAVTVATCSVWFFQRDEADANLIWGANALLLSFLLLAPRWRWPAYLAAGIAAMVVGSALVGESGAINLLWKNEGNGTFSPVSQIANTSSGSSPMRYWQAQSSRVRFSRWSWQFGDTPRR